MKLSRRHIPAVLVIIAAFAAVSALQPAARSHIIMGVMNQMEKSQSVAAKSGMTIEFESAKNGSGLSWNSQMCLFNDKDLSGRIIGLEDSERFDLSIYYAFGAFENGRSLLYKPNSAYHNAFYGAYLMKPPLGRGGQKFLTSGLIKSIVRYDYTGLVLEGLGYPNPPAPFEAAMTKASENVTVSKISGWKKWEATIDTVSVNHGVKGWKQHYFQFGKPQEEEQKPEFEPIKMYGRVYARYFEESDVYVILYLLAPEWTLLEQTDQELLSKTKINSPQ